MRIYVRNRSGEDQRVVLIPKTEAAEVKIPNPPVNRTLEVDEEKRVMFCLAPRVSDPVPFLAYEFYPNMET